MFVAGEHSKLTVNTKNVFIECTGTDFTKVIETFRFYFPAMTMQLIFKICSFCRCEHGSEI